MSSYVVVAAFDRIVAQRATVPVVVAPTPCEAIGCPCGSPMRLQAFAA